MPTLPTQFYQCVRNFFWKFFTNFFEFIGKSVRNSYTISVFFSYAFRRTNLLGNPYGFSTIFIGNSFRLCSNSVLIPWHWEMFHKFHSIRILIRTNLLYGFLCKKIWYIFSTYSYGIYFSVRIFPKFRSYISLKFSRGSCHLKMFLGVFELQNYLLPSFLQFPT